MSLLVSNRFIPVLMACAVFTFAGLAQPPRPVVKVTIQDDKTEVVETAFLPVDPAIRAQPQFVGNMSYGLNVEGNRLTFGGGSARTSLKIDNQVIFPNAAAPKPLPPNKAGKQRVGQESTFQHGKVKITQVMEVVPGKPHQAKPGQRRKMDTLLVRYLIENNDTVAHNVGVRMFIDTYCRNNDGCLFANPVKFPNKILDGVEFKGKDVPDWVMILEQPNLQNPGYFAYFTYRCGSKLEPPTRVVLTSLRVNDNGWDVPAVQAGGDSAVAFYWELGMIAPGARREVAFAHGGGLAAGPENEGRVNLVFGGNFEPGKTFTIAAYVDDPLDGQHLTLELPAGMTRREGKETQPVPVPSAGGSSMILWKASVEKLGEYAVRVRSSNGVTLTRNVRISNE